MLKRAEPMTKTICERLQALQRDRATSIKSRLMIENRLTAVVASTVLGYRSGLEEKERRQMFEKAAGIIKAIAKGKTPKGAECVADLVTGTNFSIEAFDSRVTELERVMLELAKQLPAAGWVMQKDQRGFGLLSLATIVGEAGDLSNYPNPGKLWKRLGLAPFRSGEHNLMPSTYRMYPGPKLSADEWSTCGYSPRRRSISYIVGENIVKQNCSAAKDGKKAWVGPYRKRYDESKARAAEVHEDWKPIRCHRHGMLLATKRLILELWKVWVG